MNPVVAASEGLKGFLDTVYGGLPPERGPANGELLHVAKHAVGTAPGELQSWRVVCGSDEKVQFGMQLALPPTTRPIHPVLICGDACWPYLDDAVKHLVLERGCALAWFNRTEVAEDLAGGGEQRRSPLYRRYPVSSFGALSAWAWAFQRAMDVLETHPAIDRERMGVVGHSRGGKAALIADSRQQRWSRWQRLAPFARSRKRNPDGSVPRISPLDGP
jgi:hypothetical protein